MVRCDSRSFTQSVTYFETDVASGSSAAIVSACLFVFRHLWLILVELLRQSPALLLQSVHRCESTREHQKWRLQHEAADYTSRQPSLRYKILVDNHNIPTIGHMDIHKTVDIIEWAYLEHGIWNILATYV